MSYTVLARKYRSRTFDEVVGQQPIAQTLTNAIKAARIHHGYLFTGTRGVGKTSMARILAKALNCLSSDKPTPAPCLKCEACLGIAEGQDIDVIEIDAASNTGVDNIRELRSNAAFKPARSRFKIYIIDEVHMLSTGAFNALLKTLEEPPGHVKFILATTEIQKVPATIQSRCQRFNFRNIGPEEVARQLECVVKSEGAQADPAVIRRVARLANGSMRDGLSILDQLLSLSPGNLSPDLLDEVIPPAHDGRMLDMLRHMADGDSAAVLADVEAALGQGRTLEVFCSDLIDVVHTLLLLRAGGPNADVDIPGGARDDYAALAGRFELSQYVQMIAMVEELRRNVHYSGSGRALTDAVMVRLVKMSQWAAMETIAAQVAGGQTAPARSTAAAPAPAAPRPAPREPVSAREPLPREPARAAPPDDLEKKKKPDTEPALVASRRAAADATRAPPLAPQPPPIRQPQAGPAPQTAVTAEEKSTILKDPVVRQALELFGGNLLNVERRPLPAADVKE